LIRPAVEDGKYLHLARLMKTFERRWQCEKAKTCPAIKKHDVHRNVGARSHFTRARDIIIEREHQARVDLFYILF
jgi:hypothetical protein